MLQGIVRCPPLSQPSKRFPGAFPAEFTLFLNVLAHLCNQSEKRGRAASKDTLIPCKSASRQPLPTFAAPGGSLRSALRASRPSRQMQCPLFTGKAVVAGLRGHPALELQPPPPKQHRGVWGLPQEADGGDYAALSHKWGKEEERKGLPPCPAILPVPPQCRPASCWTNAVVADVGRFSPGPPRWAGPHGTTLPANPLPYAAASPLASPPRSLTTYRLRWVTIRCSTNSERSISIIVA